jgi:hypothetical protein
MNGEKSTHRVYVVEDKGGGEGKQGFWTPCGVAWAHRDGKGLNLQLAAGGSVSGRVVVCEVDADGKTEGGARPVA